MISQEWTVEMLDELPEDGNKYELIDGELLVTPAPTDIHQLVVGALFVRLYAYVRQAKLNRAIGFPSDVRKDDRSRNRVQPDVFVFRMREGEFPAYPYDQSDLALAVEVVSPSSRKTDYQTKRRLYLSNGVGEYWIVDTEMRTIVVCKDASGPAELLTDQLRWQPVGMPEPFVLDIQEFFETALS